MDQQSAIAELEKISALIRSCKMDDAENRTYALLDALNPQTLAVVEPQLRETVQHFFKKRKRKVIEKIDAIALRRGLGNEPGTSAITSSASLAGLRKEPCLSG